MALLSVFFTRSVCSWMEMNFRKVLPRRESGELEKAAWCERCNKYNVCIADSIKVALGIGQWGIRNNVIICLSDHQSMGSLSAN